MSEVLKYLSERVALGAVVTDLRHGTWAKRGTVHVEPLVIEAFLHTHCGFKSRAGCYTRRGAGIWNRGGKLTSIKYERRPDKGFARALEHHHGEFYTTLVEALARWGPPPRAMLAAFTVDHVAEYGAAYEIGMGLHDMFPGLICLNPECTGNDCVR